MPRTKRAAKADTAQTKSKKARKGKENYNQDICEFLREFEKYESQVNGDTIKGAVYRKAANALAKLDHRISSGEEAQTIKGIGESIGGKIDEYLKTGHVKKLDKIHHDPKVQQMEELEQIMGVGPAKAHELLKEGVTTVEELKDHEGLTHMQEVGVKYHDDLKESIPRQEVEELRDEAFKHIRAIAPDAEMEVCGAYRRGGVTADELTIVMTIKSFTSDQFGKDAHYPDTLEKVVERMQKENFVIEAVNAGKSKFSGICKLPKDGAKNRRILIRFLASNQFPAGVLQYTGTENYVRDLRLKAVEMGLHLNEYGIFKAKENKEVGEALPMHSEKDIFKHLGMEYVRPEDRTL